MIAGLDVAEQQRHPYLGQGSHVGAHDPHPSPGSSPGKLLSRYTQKLRDGLLIKLIGPIPPLAILALLALFLLRVLCSILLLPFDPRFPFNYYS